MTSADLPALRKMHADSGFAYDFPDLGKNFEAVHVVTDENGKILMAAAAERLVQLYLFCGDSAEPFAALHAIRLLHESIRGELAKRGYRSAEAFLPPAIEQRFGRRLMKTFGWVKNWASYSVAV